MNLKLTTGGDSELSVSDLVELSGWDGLQKLDPYLHDKMRKLEADGCKIYVIPVTAEWQAMCLSLRQKIAAIKDGVIVCSANIVPDRTPSQMTCIEA